MTSGTVSLIVGGSSAQASGCSGLGCFKGDGAFSIAGVAMFVWGCMLDFGIDCSYSNYAFCSFSSYSSRIYSICSYIFSSIIFEISICYFC